MTGSRTAHVYPGTVSSTGVGTSVFAAAALRAAHATSAGTSSSAFQGRRLARGALLSSGASTSTFAGHALRHPVATSAGVGTSTFHGTVLVSYGIYPIGSDPGANVTSGPYPAGLSERAGEAPRITSSPGGGALRSSN